MAVNLVNVENVSKVYGTRALLDGVSLGVSEGDRIGVVGRNGDGKTTLLQVLTGQEPPDSGRVSMTRGLVIGYLHQGDTLDDTHSVRDAVLGGRPDHVWAAEPQTREASPEPNIWPLLTAIATTVFFIGSIFTPWAVLWGTPPMAIALIGWFWPTGSKEDEE